MSRTSRCIALTCLLLTAAGARAQTERFELRLKPKLELGDWVEVARSDQNTVTIRHADGRLLRKDFLSLQASLRHEFFMAAPDHRELMLVFLLDAENVRLTAQTHLGGTPAPGSSLKLDRVLGLLARKEKAFAFKTDSLVSSKVEKLSAPEIAVVKRVFGRTRSFAGWPETDLELLPNQPAPPGATWTLPKSILGRWLDQTPALQEMEAQPIAGRMQFIRLKMGRVAQIDGQCRARVRINDTWTDANITMTLEIDTDTGLWQRRDLRIDATGKVSGAAVEVAIRRHRTMKFHKGHGKQFAMPTRFARIGWERPKPDTNRWRDAAVGVSLDVPKSYRSVAIDDNSLLTARFEGPSKQSIGVSHSVSTNLLTLGESLTKTVAGFRRALKGYRVVEQEEIVLPGNVPALLLRARAIDDKVTLLSVVAVDGLRGVTVNGACRSDQEEVVTELERVLRTLRVFEPGTDGKTD